MTMMTSGSLCTDWLNADQLARQMEIGDLIEFRRVVGDRGTRIYSHWAVVIDRSSARLVHISTDNGDFEVTIDTPTPSADSFKDLGSKLIRGSTAEVRSDELTSIARGCKCRINNFLDNRMRPFPPVIVVDRALLSLGSKGYNILFNNCEHFVKWCRYGARESDQAIVAKTVICGATAMALCGSFSIGAGTLLTSYAVMRLGRVIRTRFFPRYPAALL